MAELTVCEDIVAATASCSSVTIASQEDADTISSCSTITGDLVLATNSAGSIALDGVQVIEGSFTSELCSSGSSCSGLASLSSSTLTSVSYGVTLQSFSSLTNINFPQLLSTGSAFSLEDLPALQNVSIPQLASTENFHISNTPQLTNLTLDLLQNVSSVTVTDVGLSTFPTIVSTSKITSFIVSGINNIGLLTINTPYIGLLDVQGNGTLGFILGGSTIIKNNITIYDFPISSIDTVNLFGIGSVAYSPNATITNFNATSNNFSGIGLGENKGLTNIYIIDNPHLKSISWPDMLVLNNITITGNPLLTETVGWSVQNVTNYYVTGSFNEQFV